MRQPRASDTIDTEDRVREVIEAHSQSRQATASALQRAGASAMDADENL